MLARFTNRLAQIAKLVAQLHKLLARDDEGICALHETRCAVSKVRSSIRKTCCCSGSKHIRSMSKPVCSGSKHNCGPRRHLCTASRHICRLRKHLCKARNLLSLRSKVFRRFLPGAGRRFVATLNKFERSHGRAASPPPRAHAPSSRITPISPARNHRQVLLGDGATGRAEHGRCTCDESSGQAWLRERRGISHTRKMSRGW